MMPHPCQPERKHRALCQRGQRHAHTGNALEQQTKGEHRSANGPGLLPINTRGLLRVEFYPLRIVINLALLILETVVILGQGKYWAVIVTVLTAAVCLFNVRGTVGMALHLLQKVKKRRAA